jgi:hypothetical protein
MCSGQSDQGLQSSDSHREYPRISFQTGKLEVFGSHLGPLRRQKFSGLVGQFRLHLLCDGEVLLEEGSGEDLFVFGGVGQGIVLLKDLGLAFVVEDFGLENAVVVSLLKELGEEVGSGVSR